MVHHNFHPFTACTSFMRLWALYLASGAIFLNYNVALLDPYHMDVLNMECPHRRDKNVHYLWERILENPNKFTLLVPYHDM